MNFSPKFTHIIAYFIKAEVIDCDHGYQIMNQIINQIVNQNTNQIVDQNISWIIKFKIQDNKIVKLGKKRVFSLFPFLCIFNIRVFFLNFLSQN